MCHSNDESVMHRGGSLRGSREARSHAGLLRRFRMHSRFACRITTQLRGKAAIQHELLTSTITHWVPPRI